MSQYRLLVVDDDERIRTYIEKVGREMGYETRSLDGPEGLGKVLQEFDPHAVLLDLVMPGMDGIEILKSLATRKCAVPILLMSGMDRRTLGAAQRLGREHGLRICGGMEKPFTPIQLRTALEDVMATHRSVADDDLRRALTDDELVVYYQPKVDTQTGRPLGVEALVRWNHPQYGLLLPAYFLPLAERSGTISDVTRWVGQRALEQLARWAREGIELTMAINVPAQDLARQTFPDEWGALMARAGIPAERVILEVTENQAMSTAITTTEVLTRLRLQGVELAIDDFGTGFSSMSLLQRLPFSEVKIDKSFTMEAVTNEDARTIVRATIDLGHNLGLRVVAEGVENKETWQLLAEMGCDEVQGYCIGYPMPAGEFLEWLERGRELRCSA
jgi:EAL domain-containing protein (putative c-di-GMP-specific phosphodiesterase class I)/ActR/RegA family two-component response regulator